MYNILTTEEGDYFSEFKDDNRVAVQTKFPLFISLLLSICVSFQPVVVFVRLLCFLSKGSSYYCNTHCYISFSALMTLMVTLKCVKILSGYHLARLVPNLRLNISYTDKELSCHQ